MSDSNGPAYLIACGKVLGGTPNPEYGKRTAAVGRKANLETIAFGEVGGERLQVLEGELPAGATFTAVEQFPSMQALQDFYYSEEYQSAIPFRAENVKFDFVLALDGFSEEEMEAQRKAKAEYYAAEGI